MDEQMLMALLLSTLQADGQAMGESPIPPELLEHIQLMDLLRTIQTDSDSGNKTSGDSGIPQAIPVSVTINGGAQDPSSASSDIDLEDTLLFNLLMNIARLYKTGMRNETVDKYVELNNNILASVKQTFKLTMDETGKITCEEVEMTDEEDDSTSGISDDSIYVPGRKRTRHVVDLRARSPSPEVKARRVDYNINRHTNKWYNKSATKLSLSGLACYADYCFWCESPHHKIDECNLYLHWIWECNPDLTKPEIEKLMQLGPDDNPWDYVFNKPDGEYITPSGEVRILVRDKKIRNMVPSKYQNRNIPYADVPMPCEMRTVRKLSDFKLDKDKKMYNTNVCEDINVDRLMRREKEYKLLNKALTPDAVAKLLEEMKLEDKDVDDAINTLMWNPSWKDVPGMIENTPKWVLMRAHMNSIAAHNAIVVPVRSRTLRGGWNPERAESCTKASNSIMLRYVITTLVGGAAVDYLKKEEKEQFEDFVDTMIEHCNNHKFNNVQIFNYISSMLYLHNCQGSFSQPPLYQKEVAALVSSLSKMFSNRDIMETLYYHLPGMNPEEAERLVRWTDSLLSQECMCLYHQDWPVTGPLPYTAQSIPPMDYLEKDIARTDPRVSGSNAYFLAIETVIFNLLTRAHHLYNPYGPTNILEEHKRAKLYKGKFTPNEKAYFRQKFMTTTDLPMEIVEERIQQLEGEKMAVCPCKYHGMLRSMKDYGYEWQTSSKKLLKFPKEDSECEWAINRCLCVSSYPEDETDYEEEMSELGDGMDEYYDHWSPHSEGEDDIPSLEDLQREVDAMTTYIPTVKAIDTKVMESIDMRDAFKSMELEISTAVTEMKEKLNQHQDQVETMDQDQEQIVEMDQDQEQVERSSGSATEEKKKEEPKERGEIEITVL